MTTDLARAWTYLTAPAAQAAVDLERPRCHFTPPARWMNDSNGTIYQGGWYHVFYHVNPFGDTWGFMHWGHARSRDLVHWEHLPIALAPEIEDGEEHCYSGCIAVDRMGAPRLFYTSVAFAGGRPCEQWRASPRDSDLISWERDRRPAVTTRLAADARDPFVFHWRGRSFLIVGDRERVAPWESYDGALDAWEPRDDLFRAHPSVVPFCECPNFLPMGDADGEDWLLLLSPYRPVEWRRGRFDGTSFTVESSGRLDQHDHFYATNTLTDAAGRTVVLGWIRGFLGGRGWSGCLAFPRLVEADERAGIRQQPHPCVADLHQGALVQWEGMVAGEQVLATDVGDAMDVAVVLQGPAQLRFAGHHIVWDGAFLHVAGSSYPVAGTQLDLRLLIDRSVIEIFADGGRMVVTRTCLGLQSDTPAMIAGAGIRAVVTLQRLASARCVMPC